MTELVNTPKNKRPSSPPKPFRYRRPAPRKRPRYSTPDEVRKFFT